MTAVGFYFDDNIGWIRLVAALRLAGVNCTTSRESGTEGLPDEQHIESAGARGYVVATQDVKDFAAIHGRMLSNGVTHHGIVIVKQEHHSLGDLAARLLRIVAELSAEEFENRIEYLTWWALDG